MRHLEDSLGFLIFRTNLELKSAFIKKMKKFDLTPDHWIILNCLYEKDGINQTELAEKTYKDRASLTRILDRMIKKGWIFRKSDPEDGRSLLVYITDQGRNIKTKAEPYDVENIQEVTSHMTEEEIYLLKKLIRKLADKENF
ncbi:MarR family winged helix-turn-helix transcriptional regulator [Paenibacillus sp. 8b26]|uniref:MarR family winged helix-turn-helix transcriptional regulator n=1 Tax=Paenibacillus sp. 8b26 TaxID=3424133 RepID=UPI003D64F2A9